VAIFRGILPRAALFRRLFREGREAENAQQQKKDYENIYKFSFKAPEPDRTAQFRTTASD
jgi:hypothetical protein